MRCGQIISYPTPQRPWNPINELDIISQNKKLKTIINLVLDKQLQSFTTKFLQHTDTE